MTCSTVFFAKAYCKLTWNSRFRVFISWEISRNDKHCSMNVCNVILSVCLQERYQLSAVLNHTGQQSTSGHYTVASQWRQWVGWLTITRFCHINNNCLLFLKLLTITVMTSGEVSKKPRCDQERLHCCCYDFTRRRVTHLVVTGKSLKECCCPCDQNTNRVHQCLSVCENRYVQFPFQCAAC